MKMFTIILKYFYVKCILQLVTELYCQKKKVHVVCLHFTIYEQGVKVVIKHYCSMVIGRW